MLQAPIGDTDLMHPGKSRSFIAPYFELFKGNRGTFSFDENRIVIGIPHKSFYAKLPSHMQRGITEADALDPSGNMDLNILLIFCHISG